jgi:hypothetical protein
MPRFTRRAPVPVVRSTALLVVEGDTEQAFCKYLRRNFNRNSGLCVTIYNARGRSLDQIVDEARAKCRQASYDRIYILMDEDCPIQLRKTHKTIQRLNATLWLSAPCCIEGFFLNLLGHSPPSSSAACKETFHRVALSERHKLDPEKYFDMFPADLLESLRANHRMLDDLIKLFSNRS